MSLEERAMQAVDEMIEQMKFSQTSEIRRALAIAWVTGRGVGLQDSVDILGRKVA